MLPIDRTNLTAAQTNQVPNALIRSALNIAAIQTPYDTIDELNAKVDALISSGALSPYPPGQYNRLINGGFAVNQRVASGTVTLAAGAYGHDRWKAGAAGCTYTFATVNNVTTITITAGSLLQVIEGINLLSGNHTLSWVGTSQGKIGAGSYGASGIKASVVGGTNLSIEFNAGTLSKVQFNAGDAALPFQPRSFGDELALCLRYYEKSYDYGTAPATASTSAGLTSRVVPSNTIAVSQQYGTINYKVPKRIVPTTTIYPFTTPSNSGRVSDANGLDLGSNTGATTYAGTQSFNVYNGSGVTATTINNAVIFHWASDAEL